MGNQSSNENRSAFRCQVSDRGLDGTHISIHWESEVKLHAFSFFHYFESNTHEYQSKGATFKGGQKTLNQEEEKVFQLLQSLPENVPNRSDALETIYKLYPTLTRRGSTKSLQ